MFRVPAPITGTGTRSESSAPLDCAVRPRLAVVERLWMGDREDDNHVVVYSGKRAVTMVVVRHEHRKLEQRSVRRCADVLVGDMICRFIGWRGASGCPGDRCGKVREYT